MKRMVEDVKEQKPCKNAHRLQYVEKGKDGHVWQYCTGCDRKLFVR